MVYAENMTDLDRVLGHLEVADCWEWKLSTNHGYGQTWITLPSGQRKLMRVHRFVYESLVGPIGDDLHLDHLCKNKKCANPDHLEPVTLLENLRRGGLNSPHRNALKTHCKRGHDLANAYLHSGSRFCRTCNNERSRAWHQARRAAA